VTSHRWYPFNPTPDEYGGILRPLLDARLQFIRFSREWSGWAVAIYQGSEGFGDFISHGSLPAVVTRRALDHLGEALRECAIVPIDVSEVLDAKCEPLKNPPAIELFAVDPPILKGALDLSRSKVNWLDDDKTYALGIDDATLVGAEVAKSPIFRLAERPTDAIVSDEFRTAVEKHGLKGLRFPPLNAVWLPR
jgi:hypothetical protein